MRRRFVVLVIVAALFGACGSGGEAPTTTRVTVGPLGPLESALLTKTQLRQVPGLATATVKPLADMTIFADDDPRAPCGATVPRLALTDTAAVTIAADNIRGGVELLARLAPGAAKQYLDARQATTSKGCAPYETKTPSGLAQRVQLVRVVRLYREFEQGLAVVMALTVGETVRAATEIELRRGDILARTVIYTNTPMSNVTVRGLAAVMAENFSVFDS